VDASDQRVLRLEVGPVDLARRIVRREDKDRNLTTKEAELLAYLADNAGRDIAREELLQQVWGYGPNVVSRTADTTMQRLRAKIERDSAHPRHLLTVHGVGYRFEPLGDGTAALPAAAVDAPTNQPSPTNLRPDPGRFIGRSKERESIRALLCGDTQVVTLLGPGGAGKTRLAREASLDLADGGHFPGGVWFCDLTEARDTAGVLRIVGAVLDVPLGDVSESLRDPVDRIGKALLERGPTLLVHDNAEQVVEDGAHLLAQWSKALPDVRWLFTSRERLRIAVEEVIEVEPLPLDQATELFLERAAQSRPGLAIDRAVRAEAERIVEHLDGLPLAIELVAPRMAVLDPSQIRERLGKRFQLASSTRRDLPPRQRTLRAALDWSWDLLTEAERSTLAQVGVFRGGFSAALGEQLVDLSTIPDAPWTPDVFQLLLDKSLLRSFEPPELPGETRLGMLESVREYALDRLTRTGTRPDVEARHRDVVLRLTRSLVAGLDGEDVRALHRLGSETHNLQAVLDRDPTPAEAAEAALALEHVLAVRGPIVAHQTLLDAAVEAAVAAPVGLRARLLMARARARRRGGSTELGIEDAQAARALADQLDPLLQVETVFAEGLALDFAGRTEEAIPLYAQTRADFEALGSRRGTLRAVSLHAFALWQLGRRDEAEPMLRAALRSIGDDHMLAYGARMLATLGLVLGARGRWEEALELLRTNRLGAAMLGSRRGDSLLYANLGALRSAFGEIDTAVELTQEALRLHREGDDEILRAVILRNLGLLEADRGDHGEAQEHLGTALTIHLDLRDDLGAARVWTDLGELALLTGALDDADAAYVKAAAAADDAGDPRQGAIVRACHAVLKHVRMERAQARAMLEDAIDALEQVGPRLRGILFSLAGAMAADRDELDDARALLERAEATLAPLGDRNGDGALRLSQAVLQLGEARATSGNEAAILRERAARAVAALAAHHAAHELAVPRLLYENARRRV